MDNSLFKFNWKDINNYTDEEISYFLFLEGKSAEAISKIRNIEKETVKSHIIHGKIKYRFLVKSKDERELLNSISKAGKYDKLTLLSTLDQNNKEVLLKYIRENYISMPSKDRETAVWIIGELKDKSCNNILIKASVNKLVNVRRLAISAMGKIEDEYFLAALIKALDDCNPQVISYAVKALIKLKSGNAKSKIERLKARTDKEYIVRLCEEYLEVVNTVES